MKQNKHPKTTVVKFTYGGIYHDRIYCRSALKHLGSLSIKYLINMYNTAPNTNTILHLGKGAPTISPNQIRTKTLAQATDPYRFYHPLPKH